MSELPARAWLRHALLGMFAACAVSAVIAVPESRSALTAAGTSSSVDVFLTTLGLLSPLAVVVGALAGLLAGWVAPGFSLGSLRARFNAPERRPFVAALAITAAPSLLLWAMSTTRASLALFSSGLAPGAAGALSALCASALAAALAGAAVFVAGRLQYRISPGLNASLTLAGCCGLLGISAALLIGLGETSGAGGVADVFGVLRREELDLRPVTYLAALTLAGFGGPLLLRVLPNWAALALPVAVLGALPLANRTLAAPLLPVQVERDTALAKSMLRVLHRASDRDGDGFGALFGGGDCDDRDSKINPAADDTPGNGADEDCSGADAALIAEPSRPTAEATAKPTAAALKIPEDLSVLFITIDTLRYDLGFRGYQRAVSPNIDALAKRSVVFENAYALASYTSKSLGPLLIGRYGCETNRGWLHFNRYPASDVMLQERLQAAGVYTVSVQGHWYFDVQYGLGRGFDILDMTAAPKSPQKEGDKSVNSAQLTDAALKQLSQLGTAPRRFFMWVHYLDPHAEYVAHEQHNFGTNQRAKYDSEVAFTDHHVGRLLNGLAASALAKHTAIILTSDHGEAFGEHGMVRHGFELWEELIKVPLLVYVPGLPPRNIVAARGAIDLVPTILQLLRGPVPTADAEDFLSGQPFTDDLFLGPAEAVVERPVFVDMQAGPYNSERQAYIADGLKLVTSNSRPMGLYDLKQDPGEKKNLLGDAALVQQQLTRFKLFRSKLKRIEVKPTSK